MAAYVASSKLAVFIGVSTAIALCVICSQAEAQASGLAPALIVFGDSTVDPGNNNQLNTPARSNFPPYGRDFINGKPTGRFSNGKLITDFLAAGLGIKEILPAYLDPQIQPQDLITGVSFASAGSGWDNKTAEDGSVMALWKQIEYFNTYRQRLSDLVGEQNASNIIQDAIYYIGTGNADFGVSYFFTPSHPLPQRATQFTLPQYQDYLIAIGSGYIADIYNLGARRILVTGLSVLGCSPSERTYLAIVGRPCNENINQAVVLFNQKWRAALSSLQSYLPGIKLVYSDTYYPVLDAIQNPYKYGFEETRRGCCGTGLLEMGMLCNQNARLSCSDASQFLFWDAVHPTQKLSGILANLVLNRDIPNLFM